MRLFVVTATAVLEKRMVVSSYVYACETLEIAIRNADRDFKKTHPKSAGWKDHQLDGFAVARELIDEVSAPENGSN